MNELEETKKMPVLFIGHGSPMNAIENNEYTKSWRELGKILPRPKAILSISAHWYTAGTRISSSEHPETIYDMYGFPKELYEIKYNAPGSPELAAFVSELLSDSSSAASSVVPLKVDNTWGIDHGTWSVLHIMYPNADIPVVQLSVDRNAPPATHFLIGQKLKALREQGVLIFASGNVVHNLGAISFDMEGGYPWAYEFDEYIEANIRNKNWNMILDYKKAGGIALKAFPSPDHFYPLLYVLGASNENETLRSFNKKCMAGSLSMTCYISE